MTDATEACAMLPRRPSKLSTFNPPSGLLRDRGQANSNTGGMCPAEACWRACGGCVFRAPALSYARRTRALESPMSVAPNSVVAARAWQQLEVARARFYRRHRRGHPGPGGCHSAWAQFRADRVGGAVA